MTSYLESEVRSEPDRTRNAYSLMICGCFNSFMDKYSFLMWLLVSMGFKFLVFGMYFLVL